MEKQLNQLKEILAEIRSLQQTISLLAWDQQTYMPSGGAEDRGDQIAVVSKIVHDKMTSPEIGELLEILVPYAGSLPPDSDDACLIQFVNEDYQKAVKVPSHHVTEFAQVTTVGQQVWTEARAKNQFSKFEPYLKRIVELRQEYASFFAPYQHLYDPLLDDFEPGMKTAEVQEIFGVLRREQVALIQEIGEKPVINDAFLHQPLNEQKQWDFGVEVATRMGYDWNHGRQDRTAHPFTIGIGPGDVRITTRFDSSYSLSSLFSTIHEGGHGLYELGYLPEQRRSPLASPASLAVHESQSRMWENLVGRSYPFWRFFYKRFQECFPSEFSAVDLDTFYRAINKVECSLIRTEADEATYNLHIMLRLELEIALMEGSLRVNDLPEAWNAKMQDYLGITPPNDAVGILQDVHWSSGMIGYFPTYALGNLISAQLWEKINQDIPDLSDQIARGEFAGLLSWLRKNIHQYGRKYKPQQLVQRVTGSKIIAEPYIRYLRTKFGQIYHL